MTAKGNLTPYFSVVQVLYWLNYCVANSFAAVYLQGLGYSNTVLGIIIALGALAAALIGPALGDYVDRRRLYASKPIPFLIAAQAVLLVLLLAFPGSGVFPAVCFGLYTALCPPVNALNLKLMMDLQHAGYSVDYGFCRGMGSMIYVGFSSLLGYLAQHYSVQVLPAAALIFLALAWGANALSGRWLKGDHIAAGQGSRPERSLSTAEFVRQNPRFTLMMLGCTIVFISTGMLNTFLINIAERVGGNTTTTGLLHSFMAATEIPVMMLFSRFKGNKGCGRYIRFALVMYIGRIAAVAFAPTIPLLFAAHLFQPVSFAIYTAAIVYYVDEVVPYKDAAKGQALTSSTPFVGTVIASFSGGILIDHVGLQTTLYLCIFICAVGAALGVAGVGPERKK